MLYTIYVDSLYGLDTNTGELLYPVKTLSYALSRVYEGGVIVIQSGDGTSYGNLVVNKNVTIKAAYGSYPVVGKLTYVGYQGLIEGLTFNNLSVGIAASSINIGSIIIRGCHFKGVDTPISIDMVNYISIHRNDFDNFEFGIVIASAKEVCVSSNIFSNGKRSVYINTVDRLDLWKNTIYGALDLPDALNPDTNLRIVYKTLTAFDINYKRLQLPGFASEIGTTNRYDVGLNVVNGPSFNYGTDFTVEASGSLISWEGLQLEQEFAIGDVVRVMYSESGDIDPGDAIRVQNVGDPNSRIDSNSLSGTIAASVGIGVSFNTPLKIQYNNFDDNIVWWKGSTPSTVPTGSTGMYNIGETAMYRDPLNGDFRLLPSSPNIDKGDSDRWDNIYGEIGITKTSYGYTSSYTGIRQNVSPFDRDIDFDLFHRGATGIQGVTGEIGAFEYNPNETAMGNYVAEYGQDIAYPGSEAGPYATPDRGFNRSGINDLHVYTNKVPYQFQEDSETGPYEMPVSGAGYSRFRSKEIVLSDSNLVIGTQKRNDVVIIYPSHPALETGISYISPDGDDSWTGTLEAPYRTIDRAITGGEHYVIVEPGYYPSFKGVTGINLVGVERFKTIGLSGILYCNIRDGSWTGTGTYSYGRDTISLTAPSNVMGSVTLNNDADFKLLATVKSNDLMIKILNTDNNAFVRINRYLSVVTYGYTTGGITYEINYLVDEPYSLDELFSDLKIRFLLKGSKFSIYLDGDHVHGSYKGTFETGSYTGWKIQSVNSGLGEDTISNLSAFSSSISGATGISEVVTLKKLFAITGSTGIQG